MDELFIAVSQTAYGPYVYFAILVCYAISHMLPFVPVSITSKVPNSVMKFINVVGAQHSVSLAAKKDINGNPVGYVKDPTSGRHSAKNLP
jgi:hypothetical protein